MGIDARLSELVTELGGELVGHDCRIRGIAPLHTAGDDDLAPYLDRRFAAQASTSIAAALLIRPTSRATLPGTLAPALWVHDDPEGVLDVLLGRIAKTDNAPAAGAHASAVVEPGATVAPSASIGPQSFVGARATIGERTVVGAGVVVEPGAVVGSDCVLGARSVLTSAARVGNRVCIGPGAVVGSEGFGFRLGKAPAEPGYDAIAALGPRRIPHVGLAVLEDDVEIGANTCIARATFGETRIRRFTKIDNLVQIGHNVDVGEGTLMAAQVGIAGSTTIGRGVLLGGQAGIADHLDVGHYARIAAKAGVIGDVPPETTYAGYPALPRLTWLRIWARLKGTGST
ncbi:MAG: UDP-3-O-(3-hydroxymyristoyl)glucosamine N-acyltransferase [Deltaproteobacteria bacterium]|nr:UDP-3-O-(3-hydroxymyristoyl)glucosamine N-acyltransferase [Deltaproteobacteria bacterium]